MVRKLFFFLLLPLTGVTQVQIGQDIPGGEFWYDTALSSYGNTVAVGAPNSGHTRVYEETSGVWTQIGQDIPVIGYSVALSSFGNIVAMGDPFSNGNGANSGRVGVYEFDMGVWKQKGHNIDGKSAGEQNGFSVSLSSNGNVVAIGAPYKAWQGDIFNPSGTVRVYNYSNISGVWTQIGQDIDGEGFQYYSGTSISLSSDGSILAIGTIFEAGTGVVRVYKNISAVWTQIGNTIYGEGNSDRFGRSVSLSSDGNVLAVGGYLNDEKGLNAGHARVYQNISGVWTQIGDDIDGEAAHDNSGFSVSLSADGNMIAIGALMPTPPAIPTGGTRIYTNISNVWTKMFKDIDYGYYVSLSANGERVAVKAAGITQVYDLTKSSSNSFKQPDFLLYPNPATDILNIGLENNLVLEKVTIYNNLGQVVKISKDVVINVENMASGVYFVEVITNQGRATKKVIKK